MTTHDVSYNSQLALLAALYTELGGDLATENANAGMERRYWSGIIGQQYSILTKTLLVGDFVEVLRYIRAPLHQGWNRVKTCFRSQFCSGKIDFSAHKKLCCLQRCLRAPDEERCERLEDRQAVSLATWHEEGVDIHHILPIARCAKPDVPWSIYQSIVSKTPIDAHTNCAIGGDNPSTYLVRLDRDVENLDEIPAAHWLNPELSRGMGLRKASWSAARQCWN